MINLSRLLTRPAIPEWIGNWLQDNIANPRSRLLIFGLVFIVAASGLTMLDSLDSSITGRIAERQRQLARIEHIGDGAVWHSRRTETDLARVQAEGQFWDGQTDGLAQADFQTWIVDQATRSGIAQIDIHTSVSQAANNALKLRQLTAQVSGRFDGVALSKLMQAIAGHNRLVLVNRLDIHTVPAPHFEMWLGTYLRPARAV
jgi:hypothetical protein